MKKLIFIFLASTTFAALPPLAQGVRELQALLSDSRFYESLGSAEQIKDIIRTDTGYLVLTQHYAMRVELKYGGSNDQKWAGPAQFQLEFQPPVDLRTGSLKS